MPVFGSRVSSFHKLRTFNVNSLAAEMFYPYLVCQTFVQNKRYLLLNTSAVEIEISLWDVWKVMSLDTDNERKRGVRPWKPIPIWLQTWVSVQLKPTQVTGVIRATGPGSGTKRGTRRVQKKRDPWKFGPQSNRDLLIFVCEFDLSFSNLQLLKMEAALKKKDKNLLSHWSEKI